MSKIETQIWEQNPERPEGYLRVARLKSVGEVFREIRGVFGDYPEGCEEYLNISSPLDEGTPWPDGRIAVYPVTGSSEGHYIHVDVIDYGDGHRTLVLLGKTFAGWDAAWYFARNLAEVLDV
jgi:hypothetical protein